MVVFASTSAHSGARWRCNRASNRPTEPAESGRLRVGLSGGEVTKEDDDYFGDPVVEAARLCALCDSGQVLPQTSCG